MDRTAKENKDMKKILAILCALTVLFSLDACGNASNEVQGEGSTDQQIGTGQTTEQGTSGISDDAGENFAPA